MRTALELPDHLIIFNCKITHKYVIESTLGMFLIIMLNMAVNKSMRKFN